jgi:single-strand DNA-binding protein
MNRIILTGIAGSDPQTRQTATTNVSSFRLAVRGKSKDETLWITVTAFGKTAELISQYIKKGSKCGVDGKLNLDEYTDKEGVKRMNVQVITDSIEFFSSKDEQPATAPAAEPEAASKVEPIEDDLPF